MSIVINRRERIKPPKSDKYFITTLDVNQSVTVKDESLFGNARRMVSNYKDQLGRDFQTWTEMEGKKKVLIIKRTA